LLPVRRVASEPAARQTSAQSRFSRMHRVNCSTISSPRQASAQAMQDCSQSKQASMQQIRTSFVLL
jgi:hypothetical protein